VHFTEAVAAVRNALVAVACASQRDPEGVNLLLAEIARTETAIQNCPESTYRPLAVVREELVKDLMNLALANA
jgi:hypothetical protein